MEQIAAPLHYLDTRTWLGASIVAALLFATGLLLSWLTRRLFRTAIAHDRSERIDQITISFLSHLAILTIWLLLAAFYTHLVPALTRLSTALLAGVGLMSVIVGFAAQTTLGNLIAGISLVLYKPFRRGDRLQVIAPNKDQYDVGVVEDITLGFTILRTDDGREIIIANGTMAQQTMIKLPANSP
ncbi:MAG: mechanosensitive ion channel family protein [Sphingomonas sp.]|uniref:mechanosensitive ion channel domain-containing protein n=1 Tax=Sphingomonas sp. TaxID=28214 RepID=UPI0025F4796F|nr:mechanosensitive ion channel domain-containing protein [Sphingomonas sp.]MBX3563749.1 mechanosensitive ion channel family protein [Sphingomonas sp.]